MVISALAAFAAILVLTLLSIGPLGRSNVWRATVTPLASIIGSGFLICGPLLAKEFGLAAGGAMAMLLIIAYAVGAVIRFNIRHAEPYLLTAGTRDSVIWLARSGQGVLAIAYAISVAYYLKLLAEFTLKNVVVARSIVSNALVTAIIVALVGLGFAGGLRRVEHVAHATVSLKLAVIAGLLVALGAHWYSVVSAPVVVITPPISVHSISLLFGLLITVQGFETSRFLGQAYPAELRIRTMRYAQWLSAAIYFSFIILLTPFLATAARTAGVAGILDVMELVAPLLGVFVLVGAVASQLSAAVADSIGSSGLLAEVSRGRLDVKKRFLLAGLLSVLVVWLTNPFEVVALSSRAFAIFYVIQCTIAYQVSVRSGRGSSLARLGLIVVGLICALAALAAQSAG